MINLWGVEIGGKLDGKQKGGKYYQYKANALAKVDAMKDYKSNSGDKAKLVTFYLLTESEYKELLDKANNSVPNE